MTRDGVARPGATPRVVFATYYYAPYVSGLTLCVRQLAEGLVRRGLDVHVVAGRHEPRLGERESLAGVEVHRVRPLVRIDKGMVLPGLVPRVARLRDGPRSVVVPVLPLAEAAAIRAIAGRRTLPFYVCDLRLSDRPVSRLLERAAAASARLAVGRSDRFCALSAEYAAASGVVGRFADRVVEVRPPVDESRFAPADRVASRQRLGLAQASPMVGFVGRLVYEKGIPVLVRAMRRVREQVPDARLVIAGEGDVVAGAGLGAELRAQLRGESWVTFTGHVPDESLPLLYSALDVLALPSVDPLEAFGMVQVEAMLCGTPVVASDMPGVRIPVARTGMGRLAAPGDDASLADSLTEVLERRATYVRERARVVETLPSDEPIDALMNVLLRMSESGRR